MENCSPRTHVSGIFRKKRTNDKISKIQSEYLLKRSIIDPNNNSPNLFISKLERRMSIYYNVLYNNLKL